MPLFEIESQLETFQVDSMHMCFKRSERDAAVGTIGHPVVPF